MSQEKRWQQLESGQALMEYWPTIPAGIMIIISAAIIGSFLQGGFQKTADVLNRSSAGVNIEVCETTEDEIGGEPKVVDTHLIELVGIEYDGENTSVVYRVTSSEEKALSHWVLGISKEVADNIIDESESWSWVDPDPKTGAVGIKFDTGYEGGGSKTADTTEETASTTEETAKVKGPKDKRKSMARHLVNLYLLGDETTTSTSIADGESREIYLLLSGQYDFSEVTVTTKSAGTTDSDTFIAPTVINDKGHKETTIRKGCD